ncbi:MAG: hypothetical protein KDE19_18570 [Caldilineaceae bacterium]|nr:hypothetical protein [Caldilineaceae bacterium]
MATQRRSVTEQKRLSRRRALSIVGRTVLGMSVLPWLAACTVTTQQRRFTVTINGTTQAWYNPATLTIPLYATVVWKNKDIYPHTVTCDPAVADGVAARLPDGAAPWDSGYLYTGETWSHMFTTPGQYIYFSRRKTAPYLVGTILVDTADEIGATASHFSAHPHAIAQRDNTHGVGCVPHSWNETGRSIWSCFVIPKEWDAPAGGSAA